MVKLGSNSFNQKITLIEQIGEGRGKNNFELKVTYQQSKTQGLSSVIGPVFNGFFSKMTHIYNVPHISPGFPVMRHLKP